MNKPPGKPGWSFLDRLSRLLWPLKGPDVFPRVILPDNSTEPVRVLTARILLVIYDPVMDASAGIKLSQYMHWQSPDDLVNTFIQDILETSGGNAHYQVVQRVELDEFPAKTDGYRYDTRTYLDVLKGVRPRYMPEMADYRAILEGLNAQPRIANREIDEVWLFAFPHAGFYESCMGGTGAFWCNAPPMTWSSGCNRKFVVMGFSYERGAGEMLEAFGHRAENLVARAFRCQDFLNRAYRHRLRHNPVGSRLNLFQQFILFHQIAPRKSGIGTIHFAPNSERDYDWNNPRLVPSNCYDWNNFPGFQGDIRQVNADEWGNGDVRAHHKWWLMHLPRVPGRMGGVANNWWQYVLDPNLIPG